MYGSVTEVLGLTSSAGGLGLGGQECLCMKPNGYPFSFNAVATGREGDEGKHAIRTLTHAASWNIPLNTVGSDVIQC